MFLVCLTLNVDKISFFFLNLISNLPICYLFFFFKYNLFLDSKRKGDDLDINIAKSRKIERKCVDLIVLGIPWKSTEEVVRRYFEQYGEVVLCEVKNKKN